jgi:capsular exopolysaccharide synthesis family protein
MTAAEKDLIIANTELSKFKQRTGFIAPSVQLSKAAEQMAQLSLELGEAKTEVVSGAKAVEAVEKQLRGTQEIVVQSTTITQNPEFNSIVEKISNLSSERASLLQEYTPQSPEVKKMDGTIDQEQQRLKEVARNIVGSSTSARNPVKDTLSERYADAVTALATNRAKSGAIKSELSSAESDARSLPETERQFTEYMRRVDLLEKSYEMLSSKYYTLLLSEQAVLPNGMMISQARLPESAAYPKTKTNAVLFCLLGIMVSIAAAILTERLDCTVHDQTVVEKITGLAALSIIPEVTYSKPSLIGNTDSHSALMESYRILRNNVAFSAVGKDLRFLAVTSPGPGEGKSTTAVNLAVAMAMEGKKVLLVDCDLRRPAIHKQLNISRNIGFTNVVTGTVSLDDAIVTTECEGVYCLPSGPIPPNPTEFLNSKQSREVFEQLAGKYDLVIVDCPPSSGLSDMQVISTIVDGIVLVICMGKTLKPHLEITTRALSQAEAPLMGFVMNRVDIRQQAFGYQYYYYYDYAEDAKSSTNHKSKRRRRAA